MTTVEVTTCQAGGAPVERPVVRLVEKRMEKPIKWVLVPQIPTPDMLHAMAVAWQASDDGNECLAEYLAALAAAPEPPHISMTREEAQTFQNWAGMDGACAFHLIERHANGWDDVERMMDAWLQANSKTHNGEFRGAQREDSER